MIKVTEQEILAAIEKEEYVALGQKTTVCLLTFVGGKELVGFAHVQDPAEYDLEIGKEWAKKNAITAAWPIFVFHRSLQPQD